MPMYETMLVTSTTLDEEAAVAVVSKFKDLIEANGSIDAVEEWGKRRLSYPINKEEDGVYTLIHFTSGPDFPAELDRVYKITDGVLRSLIVAKDEVMEKARLDAIARQEAAKAEMAKVEAARAEAIRASAEKAAADKAQAEEAAAASAQAEEEAAADVPTEEAPAAQVPTEEAAKPEQAAQETPEDEAKEAED